MSELVTRHADLVLLLQRFGIALGFGDRTVADVCASAGVDVDFFLLVCNIYVRPNYSPAPSALHSVDMGGLVPYLRQSHDYYLHRRLPHIEAHLQHITSQLPESDRGVLLQFFSQYSEEVREHFAYEEEQVYPHVEALLSGQRDDRLRIADFARNHGNLEETLSDLLQIVVRFLPVSAANDETVSVIYDIMHLSHDLNCHSLLEEKVLVPYVSMLEKAAGL